MKYIVRNCPAREDVKTADFDENGNLIEIGATFTDYCIKNKRYCKDITDCLLKQIVEKCDSNVSKVLYDGEISELKFIEGNPLAKEILELLEIEEVEE